MNPPSPPPPPIPTLSFSIYIIFSMNPPSPTSPSPSPPPLLNSNFVIFYLHYIFYESPLPLPPNSNFVLFHLHYIFYEPPPSQKKKFQLYHFPSRSKSDFIDLPLPPTKKDFHLSSFFFLTPNPNFKFVIIFVCIYCILQRVNVYIYPHQVFVCYKSRYCLRK